MRWFTVVLFVAVVGCGTSTKPQVDPNGKDTSNKKLPSTSQKAEHDYTAWKTYSPAEAAFEVRFPSEPTVKVASPDTGNFHIAGIQRHALNTLGYTCQWSIREKPFSNKEEESEYLKGQQTGALASSKGKLVEQKEITQDGFPGRQFIIEFGSQNTLHCRSYLAGKRVITLQVGQRSRNRQCSADAIKFLDSLKISK